MITKFEISKITTIIALAASLTMGLATVPTNAAQTGANSTSYTAQKELEIRGYTCGTFHNGRIICTKEGEPDYWCTGGSCTKMRTTIWNVRPTILGGSNSLATTVYTPTAPSTPKPVFTTIFATIMIAR